MYLIYQDNIQLKNIFRILQGDLESLQRCVAAIFEAPIIHNEVKLVKKLIVSNKHPPPSIYCNQMDGNKYVWPTSPAPLSNFPAAILRHQRPLLSPNSIKCYLVVSTWLDCRALFSFELKCFLLYRFGLKS